MNRAQQWAAEFIGTALLVTAVVGSGIMGARLAGGNLAVALLANSLATAAALYVLIEIFGSISGAQFNPAVSIWNSLCGTQTWAHTAQLIVAQVCGGALGAMLANVMFDLAPFQLAQTARGGAGQLLAEVVATAGLILTIWGFQSNRNPNVAAAVACYIGSAYWFTSSTSFANPAVTVARMCSDTFAGISPSSVLPFIIAQLVGMVLALGAGRLLFNTNRV